MFKIERTSQTSNETQGDRFKNPSEVTYCGDKWCSLL